jgi:hypothetical protein
MLVWNPFKRTRYTFRTLLSPEECTRRIVETMNAYNATARGRYLMATAFGERFNATIQPGSRGSGSFMKHFVVEAVGAFRPTRDGTVDVTIGLQRSTSLVQIVWRLMVVALIALSIWTLVASPIIPVLSVSFGIAILPLLLLWSLVAYAQGMYQAGRDWEALLAFVQAALGSHAVERA